MASHWRTGEYIIEHYGILDFELNDLIRYGLDAYEPTTGYKYVDKSPDEVRTKTPIATTDGSSNNAVRINFYPRKIKRLIINRQIDIRDYNGLDEEVVSNIPPTHCRPVSFSIPEDQEEVAKLFLRNRQAIFRQIDIERAMSLYEINPIENKPHQQSGQTLQENNNQNSGRPEETTKHLSMFNRQKDTNQTSPSKETASKAIVRRKSLQNNECIKVYFQHYVDKKSIAFLAESYSWETSPFADNPKLETAKDRIKKAINRGRELVPSHQRPENDHKGQK